MITSLRIENFALIDRANIQFNKGFTVITGETGSGKSILLNALNLLLGERANYSVIGELKDKSSVEAEIDIQNFDLKAFFEENELDYFDQCIVRREISKQGRSRAFINDTPVQLSVLKAFTSNLVHIHSQYNTLELKDVNFQLSVLDVLSGTTGLRETFKEEFQTVQGYRKELSELENQLQESAKMADYNDFQLNELKQLNLNELNYEEIQKELATNANADDLKVIYDELRNGLSGNQGVIDLLGELKAISSKKSSVSDSLLGLEQRLESTIIELSDISEEAERQIESIEVDPERLLVLSGQIDKYNDVLYKHKLNSQESLVALLEELNTSSVSLSDTETDISNLKKKISSLEESLKKKAHQLHRERIKAIPTIEKSIKNALSDLKLVNTELQFNLELSTELTGTGCSKLEILFSPNAGIAPVPVHKAASGGELSRVMLALQSLMSAKTQLRTILFDDIDTGVSGVVAQKVGATLSKMGEGMQVIAITHLPQVAAKGTQHLRVAKSLINDRTMSEVQVLSQEERVEETARLMSGDKISQAALENAKALMQ